MLVLLVMLRTQNSEVDLTWKVGWLVFAKSGQGVLVFNRRGKVTLASNEVGLADWSSSHCRCGLDMAIRPTENGQDIRLFS